MLIRLHLHIWTRLCGFWTTTCGRYPEGLLW